MRLTYKLSLGMATALTIALGIDDLVGVRRSMSDYEADVLEDAARHARTLAGLVPTLDGSPGEAGAIREVETSNRVNADVQARWISLSGLHTDPSLPLSGSECEVLRRGKPVVRFVDGAGAARLATAFSPALADDRVVGVIQVTRPAKLRSDLVVRRASRALTTSLFVFIGLWGATAWFAFRGIVRPILQLAAKAERAGQGDFDTPLVLNTHDELTPLAEALNAMCSKLAAARDREREEAQVRLATMNQLRKTDRLATVGRLAADLAHELGTPLNVITERTKMARADNLNPSNSSRTYDIILDQTARITAIVRQLLNYSRQRPFRRVRTNLRQLLESTLELLEPIADKKGIAFELAGPSVAAASVDESQIGQVFVNIIMNGIQAMDRPGTISLNLQRRRGAVTPPQQLPTIIAIGPRPGGNVSAEPPLAKTSPAQLAPNSEAPLDREYWTMAVNDQGAGISQSNLSHLFEPFFSTKPEGQGTGLGLSIVQGIVFEHGGWVAVSSQQGHGSTFTVALPVAEST